MDGYEDYILNFCQGSEEGRHIRKWSCHNGIFQWKQLTILIYDNMYLYGASGHGKVIKEILESLGKPLDGFVDDDLNTNELSGLPVLHTADSIDEVIVS